MLWENLTAASEACTNACVLLGPRASSAMRLSSWLTAAFPRDSHSLDFHSLALTMTLAFHLTFLLCPVLLPKHNYRMIRLIKSKPRPADSHNNNKSLPMYNNSSCVCRMRLGSLGLVFTALRCLPTWASCCFPTGRLERPASFISSDALPTWFALPGGASLPHLL